MARYDFKKDPSVLDACFNALIGLGNDGILDLRSIGGKRWQLTEKFDRPEVPTITVEDVTQTKFPAAASAGGVKKITLACVTPTATIKYKIDNGDEQTYVDPFEYSAVGTHTLTAWSAIGEATSATEATETLTITKVAYQTTWGNQASASLTYAQVESAGGTVSQTALTVKQTKTTKYVNSGTSDLVEQITVTPTNLVYTGTNAANSSAVTFTRNTSMQTVTKNVSVSYSIEDGKTGTASATVTQKAATYEVYYGASAAVPTSIDTSSSHKTLANNLSITIATELSDKKKCHWVAFESVSPASVAAWKDIDNDDILDVVQTATVGDYKIVYLSSSANIANTSKITINI